MSKGASPTDKMVYLRQMFGLEEKNLEYLSKETLNEFAIGLKGLQAMQTMIVSKIGNTPDTQELVKVKTIQNNLALRQKAKIAAKFLNTYTQSDIKEKSGKPLLDEIKKDQNMRSNSLAHRVQHALDAKNNGSIESGPAQHTASETRTELHTMVSNLDPKEKDLLFKILSLPTAVQEVYKECLLLDNGQKEHLVQEIQQLKPGAEDNQQASSTAPNGTVKKRRESPSGVAQGLAQGTAKKQKHNGEPGTVPAFADRTCNDKAEKLMEAEVHEATSGTQETQQASSTAPNGTVQTRRESPSGVAQGLAEGTAEGQRLDGTVPAFADRTCYDKTEKLMEAEMHEATSGTQETQQASSTEPNGTVQTRRESPSGVAQGLAQGTAKKQKHNGEPGKVPAFAGDKWHADVKAQLTTLEKKGKLKEAELDQGALKALKTLPYEVALVCLAKVAAETNVIRNINAFVVKNCTHLRNQWGIDDAASSSDDGSSDDDSESEEEEEVSKAKAAAPAAAKAAPKVVDVKPVADSDSEDDSDSDASDGEQGDALKALVASGSKGKPRL